MRRSAPTEPSSPGTPRKPPATPARLRLSRLAETSAVQTDISALKAALAEAENELTFHPERGWERPHANAAPSEEMLRARAKLKQAEEAQQAQRLRDTTKELDRLCTVTPQTLNELWIVFAALEKALAEADALGVDKRLQARAKAKLRNAEQAKAELSATLRRQCAERLRELSAAPVAEVETEKLLAAISDGAKTGVGSQVLEQAYAKMDAVKRRDDMARRMEACVDDNPLDVDIEALRRAWAKVRGERAVPTRTRAGARARTRA